MRLIEAISADGKRFLSKKGRAKKKVRNRVRAAMLISKVALMPDAQRAAVMREVARRRALENQ